MNGTRALPLLIALQLAVCGAAASAASLPAAAPAAPVAAPALPPAAPAIGADYKIHPGDQLAVSVYGEPTLTQTVTVLADQTIEYPMIGRVTVGGQTPSQASASLNQAFGKYLRSPIVSVGVISEGTLSVMVLGNVKTPGKYALAYNSHVTDAIAAAGGMGPTNGDYPEARVSDASGVRDASLQAILRRGEASADVVLANNAVVYVPSPITFNIEVVGAVDKPGEVSISQGDRLSTAIAKAGNSSASNADLNAIRVTRDVGNGQTKVYNINLYNALQKGDKSQDIELQKSDVVYVPVAKKGGSAVTGTIFGIIGHLFGF